MLPLVNHSHHSAAVKTVYVVEPDDSERQRLQSVLAPTFRNIRTFDNAESFLAQRGSIQQDCLITSAVLPGMSVLELIGWLKNEGMPIPVIVLGEDTEMPLTVNIMRAGAADFIERPFTDRRLRQAVRTAMRSRANIHGECLVKILIGDVGDTLCVYVNFPIVSTLFTEWSDVR